MEAGATGRRAAIQPKNNDFSWMVTGNLWGGLVAPPGLMKSPTIDAMTRPLNVIEARWRVQYDAVFQEYQHEEEIADLRLAAWKESYKKSEKNKKKGRAPERPEDAPDPPIRKRLICHDVTHEPQHEILAANPAGIITICDWQMRLRRAGIRSSAMYSRTLRHCELEARRFPIQSRGHLSAWLQKRRPSPPLLRR